MGVDKRKKSVWRRIKECFFAWTFERQMRFFVTAVIVVTSMTILSVSTLSAVISITNQSKKMAADQTSTLANSFESELNNYKTMTIALQMDDSVQNYLSFENKREEKYSESTLKASQTLQNTINMNENINFIAIINPNLEDYLYKGTRAMASGQRSEDFLEDYKEAFAVTTGTLHVKYNNAYLNDSNYTLNMYQPIYSVTSMVQSLGLLVMCIDDNLSKQLNVRTKNDMQSQMYLVDAQGNLVIPTKDYKAGESLGIANQLQNQEGSFSRNGTICIYQKIGKWNYYLVHQIPQWVLYKTSIETVAILVGVITLMTMVVLFYARKIVAKTYKPLEDVITKMDAVSMGKMDVRIHTNCMPLDFQKLAKGFNDMMDQIVQLMEQIKMEQHQLERIRFNALQSQIQPHFLYNTLDCIHWQAIAQGNRDVSVMVKALANYYRVCLSKGKEVIPLKKEIEHIKSYLIIQNMRYDNIVVTNIQIESFYTSVMLPKMTLQPLIENCIYHGLKGKEGKKGTISIFVKKRECNNISIMVEDSGIGMTQAEIDEMNASISEYDDSFGYGVRNVNKRIELMYGDQYGLYYTRNVQGGVTVEVRIPLGDGENYKEKL